MGCRKNLTRLTVAERQSFTNAVNQLRADGGYDTFVQQHQGALGHGHGGPAFFPWHREYILRFERALQAIDPAVSLPYWDWTSDNLNSAGTESLIWRNDFMGGPGAAGTGNMTTGPFGGWGLRRNSFSIFGSPGTGGTIASRMASSDYTTFRQIEGPHGAAHVWVGGDVGNAAIAPRDPVFWLIHANVDRLWAEWIRQHQAEAGFQPYLPLSGGPTGHNLNDSMWPWNGSTTPFGMLPWTVVPETVRPADLLDHRALGYFYDTIDPECRPVVKSRLKDLKDRMPKELKDRLPKELKERLPKELKERLPKELLPKERLPKELGPKELKERGPKELKDIRELPLGDPFIRPELRPDLTRAAFGTDDVLSPDVGDLRDDLLNRRDDLLDGHVHGGGG
jgi:tyrosinase